MVFLDNFIADNKVISEGESNTKRAESLAEYELSRDSEFALVKIKDIFFVNGIGVLSIGKVIKGALVKGFKAKIGNKIAAVKSLLARYEQRNAVAEGSLVGVALAGIEKYDLKPGMTIKFVRVGKGIVEL